MSYQPILAQGTSGCLGIIDMALLLKPPPSPPKFVRYPMPLAPRHEWTTHKLDRYELPMASQYVPAWVHVLKRCGYPIDVVVLDFETYFDSEFHMGRDEKALTTSEYVLDSRFEVLGLAVTMMEGSLPFADYEQKTEFHDGEARVDLILSYLQSRYGDNLEKCTVVMQNANFDAFILSRRYRIHPPQIVDTLGLARHWNARKKHGLDTLAKDFGLPEKGDTEEFRGVTNRLRVKKKSKRGKGPKLPERVPLASAEQIAKLAGYACNDAMREWEVFTILISKLSNPHIELRLIQNTIELWTRPTLQVDQDHGSSLIQQMNAEIDKTMIPLGVTREEISGDKNFEALLVAALTEAGDDPAKYYKACKVCAAKPDGRMFALAKPDPERQRLIDHSAEKVRQLMAAHVALDSWPLHIARVNRICRMAQADGGWLGVPLRYHGAHTGRDSGGERINLQNLGIRGHSLIVAVRGLLVAPDGKVLVIVDSAQEEARVLAWIAGQWDLCEKFARGEEIYCGFASDVLGYSVRKAKKPGAVGYLGDVIEGRLTWARNAIGKVGILGCGYGMGTNRIYEYAGGAITMEQAEKIKVTYREKNQAITQFWKDIERAFIYTAKYKRSCQLPRGLRFDSSSDCDVVLGLPNGRELKYHHVRIEDGQYSDCIRIYNAIEHTWEHSWGGALTENVVQAMSRDILMEAVLRIEDRKYRVGHRIHDELIAVVDEAEGEKVLKLSIAELSKRPTWAPDCPLGAEGVIAKCYGKH